MGFTYEVSRPSVAFVQFLRSETTCLRDVIHEDYNKYSTSISALMPSNHIVYSQSIRNEQYHSRLYMVIEETIKSIPAQLSAPKLQRHGCNVFMQYTLLGHEFRWIP